MKPALFIDLGRRDYESVWRLQQRLVARRQADAIADVLLTVEHDDVITLGRKQRARDNLVQTGDIPVVEIERGGDVTYHGPGQLVGYPILALEGDQRDLHAYLRRLEQGLIDTCAALGLVARRNPGWTGAWIGAKKVASIGIAVRRWVTLHGFALNVATDLSRFATINPCGLDAAVMTSLAAELGRSVTLDEVKPLLVRSMEGALGRQFEAL